MNLSFIIPAHNEAELLPGTLRALHRAADGAGADYELIVADDGSTDRTAEVAEREGAAAVPAGARNIGAARNAGAAAARGDLLVFVDADTTVPPRTLTAALRAVEQGAIAGGAPVAVDEPIPAAARCGLVLWNTVSRLQRWAAGCFMFVRKDAFNRVGGFDETLFAAEELALFHALKRLGPVTVLRETVITSARKLHHTAMGRQLAVLGRTVLTAGRNLRRREGLDIWYGG